jgi:hypothetical protein
LPQPDWLSPLGRLVRRLDLDPLCTCLPPVRHKHDCRFFKRTDNKRCDCPLDWSALCEHVRLGGVPLDDAERLDFQDAYDPDACRMPWGAWLELLLEASTPGGLSLESLRDLLTVFDPEGLCGRPQPPAPSRARTHEARVKEMELRHDRGLSLWHPRDREALEARGEEVRVSIQGERGRHEGELQTPLPTPLELALLESCERSVRAAWLTWPWSRIGPGFLSLAGHALGKIRDKRLYRGKHLSFRAYCQDTWDFAGADVARLFQAAGLAAACAIDEPPPDTLPFRRAA